LIALVVDTLRSFGLTSDDFWIRLSSRRAWQEFFERSSGDPAKAYEFYQAVDKMERGDHCESGGRGRGEAETARSVGGPAQAGLYGVGAAGRPGSGAGIGPPRTRRGEIRDRHGGAGKRLAGVVEDHSPDRAVRRFGLGEGRLCGHESSHGDGDGQGSHRIPLFKILVSLQGRFIF
jgi:hypothetical protein